MAKDLIYGDEARTKLLKGVKKLAKAVKITVGPKGKNSALERKYTSPLITNDGVTIAKEIELENKFENMGASIIKEASIKTNDIAGDGTTTAIILSEAIISEGIKNIVAGANPILLNKGIEKATELVLSELEKIAKPITTKREICEVASVSCQNQEIGNIIGDAFEKVGDDGVITIQEGNLNHTYTTFVEGMQFERGALSPYMLKNQEKMITELTNPYIFVTEEKLSLVQDILKIMEKALTDGRSLVIIADDIEGEALNTLLINTLRGNLLAVAVKAPSFGEKRRAILEDIACITGGQVIRKADGSFNSDYTNVIGTSKKVIVSKDSTTIIEGNANKEIIEKRIQSLKTQIENSEDEIDKSDLEDRIAKIVGKVAVINVGSPSEIEMREKKLRIEDALSATRSAKKEGIVPGGGVALLWCKNELLKLINQLSGDEQTGARIISKAIEAPIRQIVKNAGEDPGVVVNRITQENKINFGYNAANGKYCDMLESGIIDPCKVTKTALITASSVAKTMLTTDCLVVDNNKQN